MTTKYTITFFYRDGKTVELPARDAAEVTRMVFDEMTNDPECSANVLARDFDEAHPTKSWVKITRYENKNGHIERVPY